METVVIIVGDGLVQDVHAPKGIEVIIRDYDVDGVDEEDLSFDEDGKECFETVWID